MRWRHALVFLSLSLLAVLAVRAAATSMYPFSLDELIYVADHIVVAEVVDTEARFSDDGRVILTFVELAVHEQLKGDTGEQTLTVWVLGGQVGDWAMPVAGAPMLDPGEQVLLFLEDLDLGPTVLGWNQGKFSLSFERARGELVGQRDLPLDEIIVERFGTPAPDLAQLRETIQRRVEQQHVPAYRDIPGLLPHKRAAFRAHHGLAGEVQR